MIEEQVYAACPDALVHRRGTKYFVLLPEKVYNEDRAAFERMFVENNLEVECRPRQTCEVWTRVMGYLRRYQDFNAGKKSEHRDRKSFTMEKAQGSLF